MVPVGESAVVKEGMAASGTHGRGAERSCSQPQTWSKLEERQAYELPNLIPCWNTCSSKALPPPQTVPPAGNQVFKCFSPWRCFLFKPPQCQYRYKQKRIAIQLKDPIYSRGFWKVSLRKQYLEQKEFTEVGQKNKEDNSLEESADSKFLRQERELKRRTWATVAEVPGKEQSRGWWSYSGVKVGLDSRRLGACSRSREKRENTLTAFQPLA